MRGEWVTRELFALSELTTERRATMNDGTRPAARPVSTDNRPLYRARAYRSEAPARRADLPARRRRSASRLQRASPMPSAPPASASIRLSTRSCRTIAARPAPSDVRTAISCRRDAARAMQQVGDVEAGDREQHAHGEIQDQQRGLDGAGQDLAQRHERDRRVPVELVHRREAATDAIHVCASGVEVRVRRSTARRR